MRKGILSFTIFIFLAITAFGAEETLYKRLGGYDAIAAVTDSFIGKMATDPTLKGFFAGHSEDSLNHIRQLVVDQLCAATGGPANTSDAI
jgi:truncated hemoglobin YjbI